MYVLDLLKSVLKECARIIKFGAEIQQQQRDELREKLTTICDSCLDAFATVKERLLPIKQSFRNTKALVEELRKFAADRNTRDAFKPHKLCGQVDELLTNLESNLHSLRYSIALQKISVLRNALGDVGFLDQNMYRQYEDFAYGLDQLATQIESNEQEASQLVAYVIELISEFEEDIGAAVIEVQKAKNTVLR